MINGQEYSFQEITVTMLGRPLLGFQGVSYSVEREKTNIMGRGKNPVARGRGAKKYEGSLSVLFSELRAMISSLPNGQSVQDITDIPAFNIVVTYQGDGGNLITDTLFDCEFTKCEISWESEDQFKTVELPLIIGSIKYNQ